LNTDHPLFAIARDRMPGSVDALLTDTVSRWQVTYRAGFQELADLATAALTGLDNDRSLEAVSTEIGKKLVEDGMEELADPSSQTMIDVVRALPEIRAKIIAVLRVDSVDETAFRALMADLITLPQPLGR
jgi:N-methylhydantoinase B/oxoprolinase/acetone carboxylase alpha subunit